jgi:hypothetical protein
MRKKISAEKLRANMVELFDSLEPDCGHPITRETVALVARGGHDDVRGAAQRALARAYPPLRGFVWDAEEQVWRADPGVFPSRFDDPAEEGYASHVWLRLSRNVWIAGVDGDVACERDAQYALATLRETCERIGHPTEAEAVGEILAELRRNGAQP